MSFGLPETYRVFFFNFTDGGSSETAYRKGVSRPYGKRRSEVKGQRCEKGFTGCPYNNHARCGMVIIEKGRLLLQPAKRKNYTATIICRQVRS